jgi:hypothetical protein
MASKLVNPLIGPFMSAKQFPLPKNSGRVYENAKQVQDELEYLDSVLANRSLAIEQVFAATHGRPMANAERRLFKRARTD